MPRFSQSSIDKLNECHPKIQQVLFEVIKVIDFKVLVGFRDEDTQMRMYRLRRSKVKWPNSKHNSVPSMAVDIAPWPIRFPNYRKITFETVKDAARFYLLAGYVLAKADSMGIKLRWGGDWDSDKDILDQSFDDLGHFELVEGEK